MHKKIHLFMKTYIEIKGDAQIEFQICKHISLEKSGKFKLLKKEIR